MKAEKHGRCSEVAEESASAPGVLGGDYGDRTQKLGGSRGQISEVAQRSRDDVQGAWTHGCGRSGKTGGTGDGKVGVRTGRLGKVLQATFFTFLS
jgi:hypothetical protein